VTKHTAMIVMNLVTPKVEAEHKPLLNKPISKAATKFKLLFSKTPTIFES
jgi:hypothetical protein